MSRELDQPVGDSLAGFDRAPDRYTGHGRETIDRMRDWCHHAADRTAAAYGREFAEHLGRSTFMAHCVCTAMKYRDRAGRKPGTPAEADLAKAGWYEQMAAHVLKPDLHPDPRSGRPGFQPYVRQPWIAGETP